MDGHLHVLSIVCLTLETLGRSILTSVYSFEDLSDVGNHRFQHSAVAALHILNNPISMECKAFQAHIERGIYDWTQGDFYRFPSEDGAVKYAAAGDARLFQYCMDLDKEVSLSQPILV